MPENVFSVKQFAEAVGVSTRSALRMLEKRGIPCRAFGTHVVICGAVDDFVQRYAAVVRKTLEELTRRCRTRCCTVPHGEILEHPEVAALIHSLGYDKVKTTPAAAMSIDILAQTGFQLYKDPRGRIVVRICRGAEQRDELFEAMCKLANGIGGAVPYVLITRGVPRGSRELALRLISIARREFKGPIHVLGMGSPSVTPILHAMGIQSTDSATWRLKAAYGKVILPGGGERHVTSRAVSFGKAKPKNGELEELYRFLKETGFPAIDGFYERIRTSFEYRALVNAWVVVKSWTQTPKAPAFKKLYLSAAGGFQNTAPQDSNQGRMRGVPR